MEEDQELGEGNNIQDLEGIKEKDAVRKDLKKSYSNSIMMNKRNWWMDENRSHKSSMKIIKDEADGLQIFYFFLAVAFLKIPKLFFAEPDLCRVLYSNNKIPKY